ncbi:MAG: alpha/beta fold hydrolase [Pseudomonadota bacterium]|nr:alpha/beta fold hydrolase [Pseudomonadota bacterium]
MTESSDYQAFDRPEISRVLFYPRPDWSAALNHREAASLMVPVAEGAHVEVQVYLDSPSAANILFFHGNGEIASDYREIAPFYTDRGINFLVADYRGYGVSSGVPTVSAMMADAVTIFDHVKGWLREKGQTGPMIVMGRSLGSASALEIAHRRRREARGLIIESGFAYIGPLLRLLGVPLERFRLREAQGPQNLYKIREFSKPTLVIHAQFDQIIAFSEGEALYEASPARIKRMLRVPGANHNNIFLAAMTEYLAAVLWLRDRVADDPEDDAS